MIIGIDMGHPLNAGAAKLLNETTENRKVGKQLINLLRSKGHTVVDCTVDANSSNELRDRVQKANKQHLDLFVSLHLNAGGGHGTETYTYAAGGTAREYAKKINSNIVKSCGFRDRGVKTANFYVLRETKAPAVLVEICFVDSQEDKTKLNCDKVAAGIATAITGETITTPPAATETYYRVVIGSYKDKAAATKVMEDAKSKGYKDAFLVAYQK